MNERNYDIEKLNDYLLGSLPEADAEHFDELSITDESFVDELKVAENDLIDSYVNKDLTGSTLSRFESHYLASPLRREKVMFARTLQSFAEKELADGLGNSAPAAVIVDQPSRSWFSMPSLRLAFAFAGVVLVAVAAIFIVNRTSRQPENVVAVVTGTPEPTRIPEARHTDDPIPQQVNGVNDIPPVNGTTGTTTPTPTPKANSSIPSGASVLSFILSPPLRGAGRLTTVKVPAASREIAAQLRLEATDYSSYSVTLSDDTGSENIWSSGKLKAGRSSQSVTARVPAKLLKSKVYNFTVSGINAEGETEIIASYPVRIVKE